jgi:long-chain fatty acid transport protein
MKYLTLLCGAVVLCPTLGRAAGYYLPNQDAFATARGNAFVATADSAAAVFYNPAGLTQLAAPQFQAGVHSILLDTSIKAGGTTTKSKSEVQSVPHLYYAQPFNEKLGFGLGINSPFGLGNDWGRDTPFSTVITEARLLYLSMTPAVAYKISEHVSVGASLSVNYADLTLEQGLGFPGSFFRFEGDDVGYSGSVGIRWQPHEQHAFGLVYATKSEFDLRGETRGSFGALEGGAKLDFMTPARAAVGYSYRPAPGWNIETNIEWLNWDELNTLNLQSDAVGNVPVPFEWRSSFIYEIGVSYQTQCGYVYAIGYDYNESSQPDANYNPAVSDADLQWLNLGWGRKTEDRAWMLTYQFGYSNRTVDGALGNSAPANGRYQSRHHTLMFSFQQDF